MPIKVYVIDFGRTYLYLQWTDPATGQKKTRSSKKTNRREAEREAAKVEDQLNQRRNLADGSMHWSDFRNYLTDRKLSGMADASEKQIDSILNQFEKSQRPKFVRDIHTAALSDHIAWLRDKGRAEDTIKSHMRHLKLVARWAFDEGLLADVPKIPRIPRARKAGTLMRGRPLSPTEVEKFAAAASIAESSKHHPDSWADLIRGLDVSGLRLGEAMKLTWDNPGLISIDLSETDRPKLRIPGEHEKSHEGTLYPITPDFAAFLMRRPVKTGYVFNAIHSKGRPTRSVSVASHVLSDIGAASGVMVDHERHCTAHDLRRSFGFRWSLLVPSVVLKSLMRHETIATTEKYYLGHEVNRLQDEVYNAWNRRLSTNTSANTRQQRRRTPRKK